jgi:hypothetical protein
MANNKLYGSEAFLIAEALKHYGKYMKKKIQRKEKQGFRIVFSETFFEMMGEHITAKLPSLTYKERKTRKY